ncbi:hypothetical protein [Streptomyces sp. NPDC050264]|uniref:hypothetical protein n=1 Tax=Streptomyces sp. NPDC050264 TaxID=3155038 RepID=UPI00342DF788
MGGAWLSRHERGQSGTVVEAEEEWSETARHLLLDGRTLRPTAGSHCPGTDFPDPIALGDGTWLTVQGTWCDGGRSPAPDLKRAPVRAGPGAPRRRLP